MEPQQATYVFKYHDIGLVPAKARKRASTAILIGGNVPFVLRSKNQAHELIGECYVHSVIEGEAVNEVEKTRKDFDGIVLV